MKILHKIGYFFLRKNLRIPRLFEKSFISFQEKSFLKNLIQKGEINCVLDIGSHRGSFFESLRSIGYGGHVISVEPTEENYKFQKEKFKNDKKLKLFNFAIGETECEKKINVIDFSNLNSLLTPRNNSVKNKSKVKVKRLDSLMDQILNTVENPKIFCKVDTQGYDLNVLKGAGGLLELIEVIQTEISIRPLYYNSPNHIQSFQYFKSIGYEIIHMFPCSKDAKLNHILEFDCILLKKQTQKSEQ